MGTPSDIEKLKAAGYADRIYPTVWLAGIAMGIINFPIEMEQPLYDTARGCCTFFKDGLCELHELGLKPTEGKLSHHIHKAETFSKQKNLTYAVAKTWIK